MNETIIDAATQILGLKRANETDWGDDVIFESDQWVLLKQWPSTNWHATGSSPPLIVDRQAYQSGLLDQRSTFIASSRLPKNLAFHQRWFDALRTIGVQHARDPRPLLFSPSIAAAPYIKRIGELFGIDLIDIQRVNIKQLKRVLSSNATSLIYFLNESNAHPIDVELSKIADMIYVLSARHGGAIHRATMERLINTPTPSKTTNPSSTAVRLLNAPQLTKEKTKQELLEQGAVDWLLLPHPTNATGSTWVGEDYNNLVVPLSSIDQSQYLLHWTRAQSQPWPDQSERDYLDHLIFGSPEPHSCALATLCQIVASNRLLAAANLTRDPTPVVCFSAVPVGQLLDHTVFRKHLARWDFLPYGLAIRRSILKQSGCRAVIYGDDALWEELPSQQRPWFQIASSKDGKIDWTIEQEWRVCGNVDLTSIHHADAFAFVKTQQDARLLSEICRWPIVVLQDSTED